MPGVSVTAPGSTPLVPFRVTGPTEPLFQSREQLIEARKSPIEIPETLYTTHDFWERMRILYKAGLLFNHRSLEEAMQRNAGAGVTTAKVLARPAADRLVDQRVFLHEGKQWPVLFVYWDGEAGGAAGDAVSPLVGVYGAPLSSHSLQGGLHGEYGAPNGEAAILSEGNVVTGFTKCRNQRHRFSVLAGQASDLVERVCVKG